MYSSHIATHGDPGETHSVTGVDAAKLISDYGIPITQANGLPAVAVLISVETQDARIKWGSGPSTGHVLPNGSSYSGQGPEVVKKLKIGNATASSNAALKITLFF